MCSNTSSGGAASAGDLGGWTPGSYKRLKRQKVPRRGPGVAKLEKILREQEKKDNTAEDLKMEERSSRFVSSLPNPSHSQSLNSVPRPPPPPITITMHPVTPTISSSQSNSLNRHVSLVPNLAQFSPPPPPPMTSVHGNGSSNTIIGRGGGVFVVGGAGVALPEKALFAITWASSKSNVDRVEGSKSDSGIPLRTHISNESNPMCPSPNLLQRKHCQDPPIMENHNFSGSATPSLSNPSSAGLYHHDIEPPSNQRSSYNYTSLSPEEVKVLGMTRPKPFSVDNSPGPQFHFQVPPVVDPRIPRVDQSSSWCSSSAYNVDPSNKISRGTRGDGPPLDINSTKCTTYNRLPDNLYRFGSPTINHLPTTRSLQREFSKFDKLPIQEGMEDSHQRSGTGGLDRKKSFHGFLQAKEQMGWKELTLSLNNERGAEAGEDDIDLNLKL